MENLKEKLIRFCGEEPISVDASFIEIARDVEIKDNFVIRLLHYKVAELVNPNEIDGFINRNFTWYFRVERRDEKIYPVIFLGKRAQNPAAGWEIVRKEQLNEVLNVEENNGKFNITLA